MRHSSIVILALTASAAGYSPDEKSWTPARQTDAIVDHEAHMAQGRSPVPTDAPEAVFGRMELQKRLDGYTLGPLTCGFVQSNGDSLVCLSSTTDTCAYQSGYMGCCEPNKDCSRIKTRCINYSQSMAGLCTSLTDYHTVCCNAASPACYTYTMTFSGGTGPKAGTFTALNCSPTPGLGKLLDYDPSWSKTHSFPSSRSTSAPSTTTTTAGPTTSESSGGGSSTNVGAIAGGTVGGVAALALVGLGAFLLLRKKKSKDSDTSSPPAAMAQTQPPQQSPPQNLAGSPTVPQQGYQGYPPQGYNQNTQSVYDPHMSMYSQQTPYSPPQSGYPQFPQQQQQQQQQYNQQYPQQQAYNNNYPSNTGSYTGSPPPHTTPSPMVDGTDKGTTSPHPTSPGTVVHGEHGQHQAPTELAVQHPVGNEHNRAELGGT